MCPRQTKSRAPPPPRVPHTTLQCSVCIISKKTTPKCLLNKGSQNLRFMCHVDEINAHVLYVTEHRVLQVAQKKKNASWSSRTRWHYQYSSGLTCWCVIFRRVRERRTITVYNTTGQQAGRHQNHTTFEAARYHRILRFSQRAEISSVSTLITSTPQPCIVLRTGV